MPRSKISYISAEKSPAAIGPYSQAVLAGDTLFISGQIPFDKESNEMVDDIQKATKIVLQNIMHIVEEAGGTMLNLVKLNVYMKDLENFSAMNEVYADFFKNHKPARAAVEVKRLPKDAIIEIEAVAYLG